MAAIKLTKGNPINLTKEAPGLKNLTIGLGWDLSLAGEAYDLDASVMITDENDRILLTMHPSSSLTIPPALTARSSTPVTTALAMLKVTMRPLS